MDSEASKLFGSTKVNNNNPYLTVNGIGEKVGLPNVSQTWDTTAVLKYYTVSTTVYLLHH